jgi:2-keto-4-pentenoate hydratase/2-oxohepta-3-ene-1,7-dioic acid hydratase in catechol pathway
MKLVTFQTVGDPRLGCLVEDKVVDLTLAYEAMLDEAGRPKARARANLMVPPGMIDFLEGEDEALAVAAEAVRWVRGKAFAAGVVRGLDVVLPARNVRLLAPLANPRKIICAAQNYWDALKERGKEPPAEPKIFSKFANSVCGWDDDVVRPRMTQELGYEAELAVVIGKRCKHVPADRAYDVVAGYMTYNDITAGDLTKRDGQNTRGKGFDTFSVMGPFLATRDEVADPQGLGVRLSVDGRVLQDSTTGHLVFDVPRLVAFCSEVFTLEVGDVIATGSPRGLAKDYDPPAFLNPGAIMETEIEGMGVCRNRIVQED